MKHHFSLILFLVLSHSFAQIINPVQWELSVESVSPKEFDLIFTANIDENWAIYAQDVEEGGPLPTVFTFEESSSFEPIGLTIEDATNKVTKYDPVFEMVVSKFYNQAQFRQRVSVSGSEFTLSGNIDYMTCDDTRCTYKPDNPFAFDYKPNQGLFVSEQSVIKPKNITENANDILYGLMPKDILISQAPCSSNGAVFVQDTTKTNSLWRIFGLGFLGGLLALLTPCVFPMIPLTVSFFTKKAADESAKSGLIKAVLYGVFIVLVYLILSAPFHLLDSVNPDILNEISTNVWLNIIFFVIFVFFAFSFFGYYELTLPASWTSVTSKGEGFGGILGVFFMALTLSIVSFSCTGPILGSLLAGSLSSDGGAWQLTAGMGGFGLALGLPFALFATFPNMLRALPKSGGWLNTTKVILGLPGACVGIQIFIQC